LTLILNIIGPSINSAPYVSAHDPGHSLSILTFLTSLTFTNEIWNQHLVFGTNVPYWSLEFEVWYYIIFALFIFSPVRLRWIFSLAAIAIAGPKIAILFPLWLMGVGCYWLIKKSTIPQWVGVILWFGSIIGFAFYMGFFSREETRAFDPISFDPQRLSSYLNNYATGFFFCLNLIGLDAIARIIQPILERFSREIRWLAGATFSLYLCHQPIIEILVAISPFPVSSIQMRLIVFLGTPLLVFCFAQITERQKTRWRRVISLIIARATVEPRNAARAWLYNVNKQYGS
jgi:peptidoglycan/LPS O-acetylase OafA/YrhL